MPPSRRHRGQPQHMSPNFEADDTDNDMDLGARQEEHDMDAEDGEDEGDELVGLDDEEEEGEEEDDGNVEEDEEGLVSPSQGTLPNHDPPPPYLREISTLASWTVSSSKPGCSIPQLRHANTNLFWQSDGPQPHYLNIHFFKLVRIVGLRLYLDFEQDESYTPTRIIFLAGSGMNDLQEWGEMKLESPRGWVWADFSGVGDVDSEDDDDDDDGNNNNDDYQDPTNTPHHEGRLPTTTSPLTNGGGGATTTPHHHDAASSDSENAAPFTNHRHHPDSHFHTPVPTQTLAPPSSSFDPHTQTPSFPRPSSHYPRTPFTSLTPSHPSNPYPRRAPPPRRPRAPKMPTLRAHLLQVKILENHQNGKDTHLRGLQVFARNDEDVGVVGTKTGVAVAAGRDGERDGKRDDGARRKKRRETEDKYELGSGIGIGAAGRGGWDGYGGDLR
ncbi:Anaphase-promoting complex subunit 10 [Curvularia clavata]|uniref:Anaphase-promoting complex subunit 10 n=1 Tax=Curvularia clavata TaxID=95742 RepID=A0A9Q8Z2M4_CURCL|nr:Anaphase-promoting complex subunit 10 [Curvularia clavata]